MLLALEHPNLPSCEDCHAFVFDPKRDWALERQGGQPMRRIQGTSPPCWKCPKGPKPFEKESTQRTLAAIAYYHQCKADTTGILPRDRIVIENNALIEELTEQVRLARLNLLPLLTFAGGK